MKEKATPRGGFHKAGFTCRDINLVGRWLAAAVTNSESPIKRREIPPPYGKRSTDKIVRTPFHILQTRVAHITAEGNLIGRSPHHCVAHHLHEVQHRSSVSALRRNDVSLRLNDVACSTQMMLCPADTNEKSESLGFRIFVMCVRFRCTRSFQRVHEPLGDDGSCT